MERHDALLLLLWALATEAGARLIRKARKRLAKAKIIDQDSFQFGGYTFYYQLKEIDGDSIDQMRGMVEGFRPDHTTARAIAVRRALHKLVMDGKEVNLKIRDDGTSKFPKVIDRESKETLSDPLLRRIVKVEPELPILMEDTFGKYAEDELEEEEGGPTTAASASSSPSTGE